MVWFLRIPVSYCAGSRLCWKVCSNVFSLISPFVFGNVGILTGNNSHYFSKCVILLLEVAMKIWWKFAPKGLRTYEADADSGHCHGYPFLPHSALCFFVLKNASRGACCSALTWLGQATLSGSLLLSFIVIELSHSHLQPSSIFFFNYSARKTSTSFMFSSPSNMFFSSC